MDSRLSRCRWIIAFGLCLLLAPTAGIKLNTGTYKVVYFAFGFEAINSDVDILGEEFSRDRLRVLHATGFLDIVDPWDGQSQVSFSVRQGLEALGASSEDSDKLSRFEGKSKFTSLQATFSRLQPILSNTALLVAAKGQYAFDILLSDEEFYLGGEQFGQGYDVSELTGEDGVAVTVNGSIMN